MEGTTAMIAPESVQPCWPLGAPTQLYTLREQVTLVRGWTQLLTRYSADERSEHETGIAKGLARIDAASRHLSELLTHGLGASAGTDTDN